MARQLPEVDALIAGTGCTGGIPAKELGDAGPKVIALERGAMPSAKNDFTLLLIRDELRCVSCGVLAQNVVRDAITLRNNPPQEASPMRRPGSFIPRKGLRAVRSEHARYPRQHEKHASTGLSAA